MRYFKKVALAIIVFVFQFCPRSWVKYIIRAFPKLCHAAPEGIVIELDDFLGEFKVSLNTNSVVERCMATGKYEPHLSRVLTQHIAPGDCCMDVGANVGGITFALAQRVMPKGKVYAFEPGPPYYERLVHNVSLNPLYKDCIVAENLGVSNQAGFLQWAEASRPRGQGNARIVTSGGITVPVITLDEYVRQNDISKVNFIKIDTEGWEYYVLEGAKNLLRTQRPTVLFETLAGAHGDDSQRFASLNRLFEEFDYDLYGVNYSGKIIPIPRIDKYDSTLACPKEKNI